MTFQGFTGSSGSPTIAKRSFRLGNWVLVPRATTFLQRSSHAHLVRAGERVRLRHCSADMEQFALTMALVAAAFSRRLDEIAARSRP